MQEVMSQCTETKNEGEKLVVVKRLVIPDMGAVNQSVSTDAILLQALHQYLKNSISYRICVTMLLVQDRNLNISGVLTLLLIPKLVSPDKSHILLECKDLALKYFSPGTSTHSGICQASASWLASYGPLHGRSLSEKIIRQLMTALLMLKTRCQTSLRSPSVSLPRVWSENMESKLIFDLEIGKIAPSTIQSANIDSFAELQRDRDRPILGKNLSMPMQAEGDLVGSMQNQYPYSAPVIRTTGAAAHVKNAGEARVEYKTHDLNNKYVVELELHVFNSIMELSAKLKSLYSLTSLIHNGFDKAEDCTSGSDETIYEVKMTFLGFKAPGNKQPPPSSKGRKRNRSSNDGDAACSSQSRSVANIRTAGTEMQDQRWCSSSENKIRRVESDAIREDSSETYNSNSANLCHKVNVRNSTHSSRSSGTRDGHDGSVKRTKSYHSGDEDVEIKNAIFHNNTGHFVSHIWANNERWEEVQKKFSSKGYQSKDVYPTILCGKRSEILKIELLEHKTREHFEIDGERSKSIKIMDIVKTGYLDEWFVMIPAPEELVYKEDQIGKFVRLNYSVQVNGNKKKTIPISLRCEDERHFEKQNKCLGEGNMEKHVSFVYNRTNSNATYAQKYVAKGGNLQENNRGCSSQYSVQK